MEQTLVTGSHSAVEISASTAALTILDRETIQALNKKNLADLLKTVPGLLIEEQGGPGGLTAISIRGGEANFTLVMIDGIPLNDPTNSRGGGVDFSNQSLSGIERIEIIRGPQSAIYGSDALAGVINIVTRQSKDGHEQHGRFEWGEHGLHDYRLFASGTANGAGYALHLLDRDDGDPVPGSTRETDEALLKLHWQPSVKYGLDLSFRRLDGKRQTYPEQSGGPFYAVIDELDESRFRDQVLAASLRAAIGQRWTSTLKAHRFEHDEAFVSPGISPFISVPPNASESAYTRKRVQWINTLAFGDSIELAAGADYTSEQGRSSGYLDLGFALSPTDFRLDRETAALFGDIRARVSDRIRLLASIRNDDARGFASETTQNLGARFQASPRMTLTANWGEGFKLPSFFALGHALVGNPDLEPESAESRDLGFSYDGAREIRIGGSWFSNHYEGLVDFDAVRFIFVNRGEVDTRGFELEADWSPVAGLDLSAHATHTRINNRGGATALLGRPEWRAGATATWRPVSNWTATLDWQWTGRQYAASLHTGESVIRQLEGWHRLDLALRRRFGKHLFLELAIDNLLDETYQPAVGFPAPGRLFRLAVTVGTNPAQ